MAKQTMGARRLELSPWLLLTGGAAAALATWVAVAESPEVTLEDLPDRFVQIEMPAAPAESPEAPVAPPAVDKAARKAEVLGKSKLLIALVGTTGASGPLDERPPAPVHGSWTDTADDPLSTFAVDVDTASFVRTLQALRAGRAPRPHEVRVEEFVNAIPYRYAPPRGRSPLQVHAQMAPSVWHDGSHLLRVGLQAREVPPDAPTPAHLTFLVDVSGSMSADDKLPLVQRSLHGLVDRLGPDDTVALVTYAAGSEVVLEPTAVAHADRVHEAIDRLSPGGGTAMADGVFTAYALADDAYVPGHVNRVIVASDGDTNIGPRRHADLAPTLARYADRGITLTTLGVGARGYRDDMMEQLANRGDGAYYFLADDAEARRVLGVHLTGTLELVARDVKVQIAFDPDVVKTYRLVGYDNRRVADHDFANDAVDAGEVGSGHQVSAVYEVTLHEGAEGRDLGEVRLRHKPPGPDAPSREEAVPLGVPSTDLAATSDDYRLAVAAAGLAQVLRGQLDPSHLPVLSELALGAANPEHDRHGELLEAFDLAPARSTAGRPPGAPTRGSVAQRVPTDRTAAP